MTGYRNFLKFLHFEVNVETKEQILIIFSLVDSIQIFQSLIRLDNNVVFCSLIARDSWGKKCINPKFSLTGEKISV